MSALRTLFAFAALFATTAAHAGPPVNGMQEVPLLAVAGQTAYVLKATPEGNPSAVPALPPQSTVVMLGSRIGTVPSQNLAFALADGSVRLVGTVDLMVVGEPASTDLIERAATKLHADELSALVSAPLAVAEASSEDDNGEYDHLLAEVLRSFRELMARFDGPLKFMAADGTEFDCYGDYVAYQWGGEGLPCW